MRSYAALCAILTVSALTLSAQQQQPPANIAAVKTEYGKLPLSFESNAGQINPQVRFLSRTSSGIVFLTDNEIAIAPRIHRQQASTSTPTAQAQHTPLVQLQFVAANPHPRVQGEGIQQGVSNYLIGKDRAKWRTNVAHYARVRYRNVYPGTDLVFYGDQRNLEYDIVLSPQADPGRVRLRVAGAEGVRLDARGNLVLDTQQGPITAYLPHIYQSIAGGRRSIDGRYELTKNGEVAFKVGNYDRARPLVIDPVIAYSTLLGGSFTDEATAIAVDSKGNAYVAGITESPDFPVTPGAFDKTCGTGPGQCQESFHDNEQFAHLQDAFVAKLNATGTRLVYSTFLGGDDADTPNGIAVDSAGNAYVTGDTESTNFPGKGFQGASVTCTNGCTFATKLNATGSALNYSVLFQNTAAKTFGVNSVGQLHLAGTTRAATFPTTTNAFQRTRKGASDGLVALLNSTGTAFVFSTLLGGSADDGISNAALASSSGNILVVGQTRSTNFPITAGAFKKTTDTGFYAAKFSPGGGKLIYSTYLPSTKSQTFGDQGSFSLIGADASENAYVVGLTESDTFATTPGAFQRTFGGVDDLVAVKLNSSGSKLLYATYYGGSDFDVPVAMAVTASGKVTIVGDAFSVDLPMTKDALEPEVGVGPGQDFLVELNSSGTGLITSSYLNGGLAGIEIDNFRASLTMTQDQFGNVYVAGDGTPFVHPTLGAFQTTSGGIDDAFVMKIEPLCALSPTNRIVTICTPGNGATVSSPVRIIAGSTNDVHVQMMQVFVDGALTYERDGETAVDVRLPITAGQHRVTVEATDLNNTHFWKTLNLTVK